MSSLNSNAQRVVELAAKRTELEAAKAKIEAELAKVEKELNRRAPEEPATAGPPFSGPVLGPRGYTARGRKLRANSHRERAFMFLSETPNKPYMHRQVAQALAMEAESARQALIALEKEGLVHRPKTGKWVAGPKPEK